MPFKPLRQRFIATHSLRFFEAAMTVIFPCLLARPVAQDPPITVRLRAQRAQEFVDQLRAALPISSEVQVSAVTYNPLVFSVQPTDEHKDHFNLTMELGFLLTLNDDELRAAIAHELGHVWIYTHRPFLQTERMANIIGQRLVDRASFEKIYSKLWAYEGASGVPMDDLLGPRWTNPTASRVVVGDTGP